MQIIISHTNCDFDAFASMVAAKKLYPQAKMCIVGSPEKNVDDFINKYKNQFEFIKEKHIKPDEITGLILVDNRSLSRIGRFEEFLKEKPNIQIIIYDHHPASKHDIISEKQYIEQTGATVSILLNQIIKNGIQITPFEATIMALGIYEDTGNFRYISTTEKEFRAIAFLFANGANLHIINKYLTHDFTSNQIKMMNLIIDKIRSVNVGGLNVAFVSFAYEKFIPDLAMLVHKIKDTENFDVIFCIVQGKNKTSIVARNSLEFIDVGKILSKLGGGGHYTAASAVIKELSVKQIEQVIIKELKRQIQRYGTAQDIMTFPADTITIDTTIKSAQQRMLNTNHSSLVINDDRKNVVGIITKKDVSKAIHHKLGNMSVETCMSTNVITVSPDTSLYRLQKIMTDEDIGRLPVVKNGELLGVVTRKDLIRSHFELHNKKRIQKSSSFRNISGLLRKNTSESIFNLLKQIGIACEQINMKSFVVGGFVRDLLLDMPNYDIDIVVEGNGIEFAKHFVQIFGGHCKVFPKFGTAIISLPEPKINRIDIATARLEYYPGPGVLPKVEKSGIQNDLYRRDFTINSMAVFLNPNHFGELIDPFGGLRDLKLKKIQVMNNMSFIEDPTRIIRAIRFEQRFDFEMKEKTEHLLEKSLSIDVFKTVAPERIREELKLICEEKEPIKAFKRMKELQILSKIYRHFDITAKHTKIFNEIFNNIIWFKETFLQDKSHQSLCIWVIYHLGLLFDMHTRAQNQFVQKYKYPNILKKNLLQYQKTVGKIQKYLSQKQQNSKIYHILNHLSNELLIFYLSYFDDYQIKNNIHIYLMKLRNIKLSITGNDVIKLGIPEGPKIKAIITKIKNKKLDGEISTEQDEREELEKILTLRKELERN